MLPLTITGVAEGAEGHEEEEADGGVVVVVVKAEASGGTRAVGARAALIACNERGVTATRLPRVSAANLLLFVCT